MFGMRMNLYSRANDAARPSGEARPDAPLPTRLQSVGPAHRVARPTSLIPGPGAVYPTRAPPAAAGTSKIPAPTATDAGDETGPAADRRQPARPRAPRRGGHLAGGAAGGAVRLGAVPEEPAAPRRVE